MTNALDELCELIAQTAIARASEMTSDFQQHLLDNTQVELSQDQLRTVSIGFAFTNWAFAGGVWSNLTDTRLRRDLIAMTKNKVILQMARVLCQSDNPEDTAYLATNFDFDQFQSFAQAYTERVKELDEAGLPFNANAAILFGLEWIQAQTGIDDSAMDVVGPAFLTCLRDPEEVERVASQVNRAARERYKRGLIARFLDGWRSGPASD